MKNSLLIAIREWKERVGSRSFLLFSVLGPMVVLALIYMLFVFGGESKQHWNVLIADPTGILKDRVLNDDDQNISYSFADNYIKSEEFRDAKKFQGFDAMLEINEQILYTKVSHVFYRQKPSAQMEKSVQYHIERRLEEVMVDRFADFSIQEYLKIKQP